MRLIEIATERYLRHLVAATVFALVAMAALPLTAAASAEPAPLARAQTIRAELDARYRLVPGRPLAVTEASTTGVVESLTLFSADPLETRTVAADNGVYFAICPPRATCPFPARRLARPAAELLPRRLALELALRTFLETSASLVVVALPTARPAWAVFERDDLLADLEARALLDQLASNPTLMQTPGELVRRLTLNRLFAPLLVVASPGDTIYAVHVRASR